MINQEAVSIAYISYNLPALTTTFIYREFLELRERGVDIHLVSLNRPKESHISEEVRELVSEIIYLKPIPLFSLFTAQISSIVVSPRRYIRTLFYALTRKTSSIKKKVRLMYHFFVSCYLSRMRVIRDIDHLHSHFASGPTSVALFTSQLLEKTFSFTAHAIDIFVDDIDIRSKIEKCEFVNLISDYNRHYLKGIVDEVHFEKLKVIYCGINVDAYTPQSHVETDDHKLSILSIGRLVEKKGHKYLIEACKILADQGYSFQCEIAGSGPLENKLRSQISETDLEDHVRLTGAIFQEEVHSKLKTADLFVLPCVIAENGDRDGIPNTLMEAMAMEVPVISCDVSGLGELIVDSENGILVPEKDAERLSDALAVMIDNATFRKEMSVRGRKTIVEQFNIKKNTDELYELFQQVIHQI